ncbi:unnamed protein product [Caenorhabditis angaria]|uniref:F-box domain-containing protein n=1 Tax=Caenorhabditis angaria TaxID=860376 RepID=A0A9P1NA58_9PELO|nr:unnamed protein product [Caenorhabditis angaria]
MGKRKIVRKKVVAKKKKEELVEDEETEEATYSSLPTEIKMVIINMLGADGRSNMSRVSKLSEALCKMSPYFLQSLHFRIHKKQPKICVAHEMGRKDYELIFRNKTMTCKKFIDELWREKVGDTGKTTIENACEHFAKMVHQHQKTIRELHIHPENSRSLSFPTDTKLERLENLKITIEDGFDYRPVFEILEKPLKNLTICEGNGSEESRNRFMEIEQIYQAHEKLDVRDLALNYEELIKIKATNCEFRIGLLSEENIADWLKMYQNGEWQHTVLNYCIDVNFWAFDCHKLWRLLGSSEKDLNKYLAIRTRANRRKMLHLKFSQGFLQLRNLTAEFFGNNR